MFGGGLDRQGEGQADSETGLRCFGVTHCSARAAPDEGGNRRAVPKNA